MKRKGNSIEEPPPKKRSVFSWFYSFFRTDEPANDEKIPEESDVNSLISKSNFEEYLDIELFDEDISELSDELKIHGTSIKNKRWNEQFSINSHVEGGATLRSEAVNYAEGLFDPVSGYTFQLLQDKPASNAQASALTVSFLGGAVNFVLVNGMIHIHDFGSLISKEIIWSEVNRLMQIVSLKEGAPELEDVDKMEVSDLMTIVIQLIFCLLGFDIRRQRVSIRCISVSHPDFDHYVFISALPSFPNIKIESIILNGNPAKYARDRALVFSLNYFRIQDTKVFFTCMREPLSCKKDAQILPLIQNTNLSLDIGVPAKNCFPEAFYDPDQKCYLTREHTRINFPFQKYLDFPGTDYFMAYSLVNAGCYVASNKMFCNNSSNKQSSLLALCKYEKKSKVQAILLFTGDTFLENVVYGLNLSFKTVLGCVAPHSGSNYVYAKASNKTFADILLNLNLKFICIPGSAFTPSLKVIKEYLKIPTLVQTPSHATHFGVPGKNVNKNELLKTPYIVKKAVFTTASDPLTMFFSEKKVQFLQNLSFVRPVSGIQSKIYA